MTNVAVKYYEMRFGDDVRGAFVHTVREIGELAMAIERDKPELAGMEITEIAALMEFLASRFGFDLTESVTALYTKKLQKLAQS